MRRLIAFHLVAIAILLQVTSSSYALYVDHAQIGASTFRASSDFPKNDVDITQHAIEKDRDEEGNRGANREGRKVQEQISQQDQADPEDTQNKTDQDKPGQDDSKQDQGKREVADDQEIQNPDKNREENQEGNISQATESEVDEPLTKASQGSLDKNESRDEQHAVSGVDNPGKKETDK